MMSRRIVTTLAAGVLLVTAASGAVAQDEELRMGDDPAYAQRVEVPEPASPCRTRPTGTSRSRWNTGKRGRAIPTRAAGMSCAEP